GRRVPKCVVVAQTREVVVARVAIAALAIGEPAGQRVVIISLHAQHARLLQKRKHAVRIRSKGAEIAEAEGAVYLSARDVRERRLERAPVTVDAADQREAHHRVSGAAAMSGPSMCPLTFPQNVPYRQHVTHVWCRSSYELTASSSVVPSRASR